MHVCISQKMKFKICNGFTGYNGYCVGVLMETVMVPIGLNWYLVPFYWWLVKTISKWNMSQNALQETFF